MPIKVEEIEVKEETVDADDTKTMIIELQHTNGHVLNSRLQSQPLPNTAGNYNTHVKHFLNTSPMCCRINY